MTLKIKTTTTPKRPWKLWCQKTSDVESLVFFLFFYFKPQISSLANKHDDQFGMEGVKHS
jgi:hypothetical protein